MGSSLRRSLWPIPAALRGRFGRPGQRAVSTSCNRPWTCYLVLRGRAGPFLFVLRKGVPARSLKQELKSNRVRTLVRIVSTGGPVPPAGRTTGL